MKRFLSAIIAVSAIVMPMSATEVSAEETTASVRIDTVYAEPGESVDVAVEILNNPGIISVEFKVNYDTDILELASQPDDCELFSGGDCMFSGTLDTYPYSVSWMDAVSRDNYTDSGDIVILHFNVLDTAETGLTEITVEGINALDVNLDDVVFESVSGGVEIKNEEITTTTESIAITTEQLTTTITSTATSTTTTEPTTSTTSTTTTESTTTITSTTTTTIESTTITTEITTTSTEEQTITTTAEESTITTTEQPTITTATTTSTEKYFASVEDMCIMAVNDYEDKTGVKAAETESVENENGTLTVYLKDENGEVLDVYVIDPETGKGTDSNDEEVNLPQTGNNSPANLIAFLSSVAMVLSGLFITFKSGKRCKKEEK